MESKGIRFCAQTFGYRQYHVLESGEKLDMNRQLTRGGMKYVKRRELLLSRT